MTAYETPFGNLYLGIFARDIDIKHTEDEIKVHIEYSMELNYEMISDCAVDIEISSTGKFELQFEMQCGLQCNMQNAEFSCVKVLRFFVVWFGVDLLGSGKKGEKGCLYKNQSKFILFATV